MVERAAAPAVETLEHLVEDDAEALVDRRLLRDPEDARELVLERAEPVGLDVRGRQHHAIAAARDEAVECRLRATPEYRLGTTTLVARGVEQVLVERRLLKGLALFRCRH